MGGMGIVEFLRARLDEDEEAARESRSILLIADSAACVADEQAMSTFRHFERHPPPRVLREVEAKRDIVNAAVYWLDHGESEDVKTQATQTLESLAAVYAGHPDAPDWTT